MTLVRAGLATIVALISLTSLGCKKSAEAREERRNDPVAVTLGTSRVGPVQRSVEITGTLFGDEEATVSAKVPGRIVSILKDVGDHAAAGEPLAQLDKTDYELAVAQKRMALSATLAKLGLTELPPTEFNPDKVPTVERARLQTANSQAKFKRGEQLFEQNPPLISEQDFADLKTGFEVAKSNYDVELLTARSQLADARARQSDLEFEAQRLRDTTVRAPEAAAGGATRPAPIRYAVGSRLTSIGEYVREGTALFRLVAEDPIKFRAQVPERFLGQVKVGQAVRVNVEAYADNFEGSVSRISPQVETSSRTFQVEMLVPNPQGRLQPGSFARGRILTRVEPAVTFVPDEALVVFAGVTKVYTIADGKAVEKKIEPGQHIGDEIEVISGLAGVQPIVINGKNKLATGTPITETATTRTFSTRRSTTRAN